MSEDPLASPGTGMLVVACWPPSTWTTQTGEQVPSATAAFVPQPARVWRDPSAADGGYRSARVNCSLAASHRALVKSGSRLVADTLLGDAGRFHREHRPHRRFGARAPHSPVGGQRGHYAETAPTQRRNRRLRRIRPGRPAAIGHLDLDRARPDVPGDPDLAGAAERTGVP